MTIANESIRLFFAISALILVGMLSSPAGVELSKPAEITTPRTMASAKAMSSQKTGRKQVGKMAKTTRKIARRG